MTYLDDRLGLMDNYDQAYVMDNYGNAVRVAWSLPDWWFWRDVE